MSEPFVDLGTKEVWGGQAPLRLSSTDRRRHISIFGQTGTGKSTLLKNIIGQDIQSGAGVSVLDPHGDMAHELLELVPSHRVDDVVFIDPSDAERPVGFNPFYKVPMNERALVASNLTAIFKSQWRDSWGPRLEYILFNVFRALLDAPDRLRPSFLSVPLVLVDLDYRKALIKHITDNRTRSFFVDELNRWPERMLAEAISPVQNKIGQFLSNPFTRNVLSQWKPSFDLYELMYQRGILIVRIPKGTLGEEPANLFGSFLAGGIQQSAMRRAKLPERERTDFHLVIDEFPNFTTGSFASVLSEARKYGLSLTIGCQYVAQMSEQVEKAVFGNVGSLISFRVSAEDADRLAKEIGEYSPETLSNLSRGEICARLTRDGEAGSACLARTVPSALTEHGHGQNIIHQSRMRFGRDRREVERSFQRWLR